MQRLSPTRSTEPSGCRLRRAEWVELRELSMPRSGGDLRSCRLRSQRHAISLERSSRAPVAPAGRLAPTAAPAEVSLRRTSPSTDLHEAIEVVRQLDPPGVACRDLRECLLYQLALSPAATDAHQKNGNGERRPRKSSPTRSLSWTSTCAHVQNKQHKEIARAIGPSARKRCRRRSITYARSIRAPACATTRCSRA